jgi:hypothetical protein
MLEKVIVHQDFVNYAEAFKPYGAQDDVPDNGPEDIETVAERVRDRAPIDAALARKSSGVSVSLDWLRVPDDDLDTDTGELDKGLVIQKTTIPASVAAMTTPIAKASGMTLAQKLGITKTTIREVDGERQLRGFNDKNELVHFKILLPEIPETEE